MLPNQEDMRGKPRTTWTRILRIWVALYSPADALPNVLKNVGPERTGRWPWMPSTLMASATSSAADPPWGCLCAHHFLPRYRTIAASPTNYCKKNCVPSNIHFLTESTNTWWRPKEYWTMYHICFWIAVAARTLHIILLDIIFLVTINWKLTKIPNWVVLSHYSRDAHA
jgi:hypothetical protein